MKYLNKSLLSIIIVMLCLTVACAPAPAPAQQETSEAPVEISQNSSDSTDTGKEEQEAYLRESEEPALTYFPTDEWRTSTPEEQGMDSELLLQMFQKIRGENIDIHSVLLVRNGHLVIEAYVDPYRRDIKHPMYSVTKSVISILTGIAMQEGYIKSVDQKVLDFFPDIAQDVTDENLQNLTLEHLLTMSAGYKTRTIPQPWVLSEKDASFDTIDFILTHNTILEKPGTSFSYDSGAPHLLSAIIQETTGMTTQEYAQKKLFDPLGITGVTWQTDPRGIPLGCTGLELSSRDMAKLGYLYLNHGQWNGKQIVPAAWVDQSTTKHIETKGLMNEAEDDGYGYFWWIDGYGGYSAHGFGGQYMFVVPDLDLVAVFTSGLADPVFPTPRKLMQEFILPAAKSADPLPASQASNDLPAQIEQSANPAAQPVAPLPDIAHQISGKTFQITEKPGSYLEKISIIFEDGQDLFQSKSVWPQGEYDVLGSLDNRFYVNEVVQGQQVMRVALKGYWQDENTFVETLKDFSQIDTVIHTYTFDGDALTIDVNSSMGAYNFQMHGEMIDTTEIDSVAAESTRVAEIDGMVQVYVSAGPFEMGSMDAIVLAECRKYRDDCQPGFYLDEEPPHTVTLDAFWIDQTEVTNGMYARCVADGRCQPPTEAPSPARFYFYGDPAFDNHPMMFVTWDDARTYCEWAGRRLPTEAEWEKAARGTDGRQYPWGNETATGQYLNFADKNSPYSYKDMDADDGYGGTSPVGSYPEGASPYGALDMAGNLREWVSSLYWPYPYQPDDGREDLNQAGGRVVRGGHWDGTADFSRSSHRSMPAPGYRSNCVGFRCASSP